MVNFKPAFLISLDSKDNSPNYSCAIIPDSRFDINKWSSTVFQRFTAVLACILLLASLAGCIRPHKSPISQGNLLRVEDIERLETGMTREQVVFLIGQPILAQPFEKSRWDYVYVSRQGYKEPVRKNITLFFENDRLARIKNNYQGAGPENLSANPTELEEAEEVEEDVGEE